MWQLVILEQVGRLLQDNTRVKRILMEAELLF